MAVSFSLQLHHNFILEKISRDGWMNLDKPVMFPWNCSFFPWTPPSLQQLLFQKIGVQILNDPSRKNFSIIGQRMSECHRWNYHFPLWRMYMLSHQYKWRTVHCSNKLLLAICFRWINKSHMIIFFCWIKITPEENLSKQMNKKRCITMHVYSVLPSAVQLSTTWP